MRLMFLLSFVIIQLTCTFAKTNCGNGVADKLRKVNLSQTRTFFQYIEFMLPQPMPDLQDFTLCYWVRSTNFTFPHTTFSYAVPEQPLSIVTQIEPNIFGAGVKMIINGKEIFNEAIALGRAWDHLCHSWESSSAQFQLYTNGALALEGIAHEARNSVIRGKGMPIAGQLQTKFNDGFDFAMGIEGEVVHYFFDSRALNRGRIVGENYGIKELHRICDSNQPKGNIISWDNTDMKIFGGGQYTLANPVCGNF